MCVRPIKRHQHMQTIWNFILGRILSLYEAKSLGKYLAQIFSFITGQYLAQIKIQIVKQIWEGIWPKYLDS